jgi:diguanylate cyclase (GGDEF)-like protein
VPPARSGGRGRPVLVGEPAVKRRFGNLVIPLVAAVLAVLVFTEVVALQNRENGYRRADATIASTQAEFDVANETVLEVADPAESVKSVARQMYAAEASVTGSLAGLRRAWPVPALDPAVALVNKDFTQTNGFAQLLFDDPALLTDSSTHSIGTIANPVITLGNDVKAAMELAGRQYEQRASRAQTESLVGTAVALALLLLAFVVFYLRWLRLLGATRRDARVDALTGLGNRRALIEALDRELPAASEDRPVVLTLYDLDGFKAYNDSFGHLAGDALLVRVGQRLNETVGLSGTAYRMGGDEFCSVASLSSDEVEAHIERSRSALTEAGQGFEIGCSAGCVLLPSEAASADAALALADRRMYQHKAASKGHPTDQSADVVFEMLAGKDMRGGNLDARVLAARTAQALDLSPDEVRRVRLAAELQDVGKTAIPDAILNKPSGLSDQEWEFIRQHTIIGERIVQATPELAKVGQLIRSSRERADGTGYPDGLAGEAIPLGARIVAACDAFDAMISSRPYRGVRSIDEAVAELRRGRGTQFDARVVGRELGRGRRLGSPDLA